MVGADGTLDGNILSRGMSLCLTRMVPVVCRFVHATSGHHDEGMFHIALFLWETIAEVFLGDLSLELVNLI
jgi:hypothetical protein